MTKPPPVSPKTTAETNLRQEPMKQPPAPARKYEKRGRAALIFKLSGSCERGNHERCWKNACPCWCHRGGTLTKNIARP